MHLSRVAAFRHASVSDSLVDDAIAMRQVWCLLQQDTLTICIWRRDQLFVLKLGH